MDCWFLPCGLRYNASPYHANLIKIIYLVRGEGGTRPGSGVRVLRIGRRQLKPIGLGIEFLD